MNKIKKYFDDHTYLECFLLGVKVGLVIFCLMVLAYCMGVGQ